MVVSKHASTLQNLINFPCARLPRFVRNSSSEDNNYVLIIRVHLCELGTVPFRGSVAIYPCALSTVPFRGSVVKKVEGKLAILLAVRHHLPTPVKNGRNVNELSFQIHCISFEPSFQALSGMLTGFLQKEN